MVLDSHEIERRLNLPIYERESLVITPLIRADKPFDSDSVDLRLGTFFLLPQVPPDPFLDPTDVLSAKRSHLRVHKPLGSYVVVPAHQTVLGATLEFIKLPSDISGQILTKSSVARTFLIIETAPWIHPLYRGCLTLEIANVSNTPLLLYPGMPIGQLILLKLSVPADDEAPLTATYVGPIEPEVPTLKHPRDILNRIGVTQYRNPHSDKWLSTQALSLDAIESALRLGTPTEQLISLLRQHGVDFTLTDGVERRLRAASADTDTLLAIAKAKK